MTVFRGSIRIGQMDRSFQSAPVAVVCAGTSDLPVAEEAAQTLEFAGVQVNRITDVGVAGLHRLLARLDDLRRASLVIAVAGHGGRASQRRLAVSSLTHHRACRPASVMARI
jgi:NCAIR mutase (PurE)-related protein